MFCYRHARLTGLHWVNITQQAATFKSLKKV